MADQVLPTWGESLGGGIRQGFEGFMEARARARQQRLQDTALALQYKQLEQGGKDALREDLKATAEFGISPEQFGLGREMSQAAQMATDPQGFRERLPGNQAQALNLFDEFMARSGPKNKPEEKNRTGKIEGDLRGEIQKLSKDFFQVRDSYSRVQSAAQKPSAAGDLSLIFNYMKILDPGSTVREGEFANAENSGGVGDKTVAIYNKVLRGERLSPSMRADFLEKAGDLYKSQERIQKSQEKQYRELAARYGGSPENVVLDFALPPQPMAPQPIAEEPSAQKSKYSDMSDDEIKRLLGQ